MYLPRPPPLTPLFPPPSPSLPFPWSCPAGDTLQDGKTLRGTAEKLRFMLNQCEFQYEDKPATQADLDAMMAAKKIVCGERARTQMPRGPSLVPMCGRVPGWGVCVCGGVFPLF